MSEPLNDEEREAYSVAASLASTTFYDGYKAGFKAGFRAARRKPGLNTLAMAERVKAAEVVKIESHNTEVKVVIVHPAVAAAFIDEIEPETRPDADEGGCP